MLLNSRKSCTFTAKIGKTAIMSNQRVNDMSNRNYNNYSIAKKTIAVVYLSLIGMLNVMAQTGTVNRTFIMTGFGEKLDTCNLSLFSNKERLQV